MCVAGGGGHGAPPAAAGPLGLPAQPRALAEAAARRPLGVLRPPRREPPLSPAARTLPGGAQRHPRGRRSRLHPAHLFRTQPHRSVSRRSPRPCPAPAPPRPCPSSPAGGTTKPRPCIPNHALPEMSAPAPPTKPTALGLHPRPLRGPPPEPRLPPVICREIDDVISADLEALEVRDCCGREEDAEGGALERE